MSSPGLPGEPSQGGGVARALVSHYEQCFRTHGDTHKGVDWPSAEGAALRYDVMLDVMRFEDRREKRLLDYGCGAGHLLSHLQRRGRTDVHYAGVDASPLFVEHCLQAFPGATFGLVDTETPAAGLSPVDYIVLNGVFTERLGRPYPEMFALMASTLSALWPLATRGIAFNLMSKHVDWEREDLFHVPFDEVVAWLRRALSRHILIRADYGLYEYTVYVYKDPNG